MHGDAMPLFFFSDLFLRHPGSDHRKFGTLGEHYPAVGVSLLATLAHFSAENWTAWPPTGRTPTTWSPRS